MNRSYNSQKFLQKKKRIKKIRFWLLTILFVSFIIAFFYWMRRPELNIEKIIIENNDFVKTDEIKLKVFDILNKDFFYLIPKSNALFLPRKEIQNKLKYFYPQIEKIDFDLISFKELKIQIFEYKPKILGQDIINKKFFINSNGVAFMEEPLLHSYLDLFVLEFPREVSIKDGVIEPEFLSNLVSFSKKLEELNIKLEKIQNIENGVYYLKSIYGFDIMINNTDNLELIFDNLKTVLENEVIKPEDFDNIGYIDLRFGNKVFYKLKN